METWKNTRQVFPATWWIFVPFWAFPHLESWKWKVSCRGNVLISFKKTSSPLRISPSQKEGDLVSRFHQFSGAMLVSGRGILNASTIFPGANWMLVEKKCSTVVLDPFSTEPSNNFEWITATAQRTSGHSRFHTSVSSCNQSLWVFFHPTKSPKTLSPSWIVLMERFVHLDFFFVRW